MNHDKTYVPFPHLIDNTIRSTFFSCPKHAFLEYFQHWKVVGGNINLHAGGAFAHGVDLTRKLFYDQGLPEEEAVKKGQMSMVEYWGDFEVPDDSPKSLPVMLLALDEYFKQYPMATDHIQPLMTAGKSATEFSFSIPLPIAHPETGDPILYGGRFDMLGLYNDQLFVVDEKTTKQLGATWPKQWTMRSQFTGYCWGAQQYDYPVAGAIIRGLAIYKKSFGHAESIQFRQQWQIDQWYEQMLRDVKRMVTSWQEGYWDMSLGDACAAYGGCPFVSVCSSQNPERWLQSDFEQREWKPLGDIQIATVA